MLFINGLECVTLPAPSDGTANLEQTQCEGFVGTTRSNTGLLQAVNATIDKWATGMAQGWAGAGGGPPVSGCATGLFTRLYVALWALQIAANQLDPTVAVVPLPAKHKWAHLTGPVLEKAQFGGKRRRRAHVPVANAATEALATMDRLLGTESDLDGLQADWRDDAIVWGAPAGTEAGEDSSVAEGADDAAAAAEPAASDEGVAPGAQHHGSNGGDTLEDSDTDAAPANGSSARSRWAKTKPRQSTVVLDD